MTRVLAVGRLGKDRVVTGHLGNPGRDRVELLQADLALSESVEAQLQLYRQDMQRDFGFRLEELDNLLHRLQQRGEGHAHE